MRYTVSFIVFIFCLLTGGDVYAQSIGVDDATKIARQWLNRGGRSLKKAGQDGSDAVSLAHAVASEHDGNANVYVFTTDRSFVIVAGDECVDNPILGFSDEGGFSAEGMPDAMKWLLGEYSQQIDVVKVAEGEEVRRRRGNLKKNVGETDVTIKVNPLLGNIHWQQRDGYDEYTPRIYDEGLDQITPTGCTATAMAQIMKYWEWPRRGTGSHTYTYTYSYTNKDNVTKSNTNTLSSNFSEHEYDWDNMQNDYELDAITRTVSEREAARANSHYTIEQYRAASLLMSDCGISVNTTYKAGGGAGKVYLVADAFRKYFGYASSLRSVYRGNYAGTGNEEKSNYDDDSWDLMLKKELDEGRPIFYEGINEEGTSSHSFVCDGYGIKNGDENTFYFHMNWGWGITKYPGNGETPNPGLYDGYYRSNAARIDDRDAYQFQYKQYAVIGIQPDYGDYWNEWVDYGNCEYDYSAFINYKNDVHVKGRLSRDGKFRELEIDNWGNGLGYIKGDAKMTCVINNTTGEVVTPPFNTGYVYKDGVEHEVYAASPEASIGYSKWTKESLLKRDNPCDFQGRYDFENKKLTLNLAYYYYTDYYQPWSGGTFANTLQLPTLSYTLPVSSAHIATLYLGFDAEIPTDEWEIVGEEERGKPHVYYVTYNNDNEVNFVLVNGGVIPAYTPVIVQAKEGNYYFWEDTNTKVNDLPKIEYNLLHGTIDEYTFSDAELENVYFLYTRRIGEDVSPVFIKAAKNTTENTQTIGAHKAWLEMPKHMSLAKELMVSDFTTKIENLSVGAKPDSRRFSITGQQVDRNYQGIVIVDGKKILCR